MALRFPVFTDIENKKILLVGAGHVAARRIRTLLMFGADITVIAREVPEEYKTEMADFQRTGKVHLTLKMFENKDITADYFFVISAVDDPETDRQIRRTCRELGVPVNIASDRTLSDFYFPAVAMQENLVVGIAGDGSDHRKVARTAAVIREMLGRMEPPETGRDQKGKNEGDRA